MFRFFGDLRLFINAAPDGWEIIERQGKYAIEKRKQQQQMNKQGEKTLKQTKRIEMK